jgi:hypothetical protein
MNYRNVQERLRQLDTMYPLNCILIKTKVRAITGEARCAKNPEVVTEVIGVVVELVE